MTAANLAAALRGLLAVCERVVPDHIATDPDHEYGRAEDAARAALAAFNGPCPHDRLRSDCVACDAAMFDRTNSAP